MNVTQGNICSGKVKVEETKVDEAPAKAESHYLWSDWCDKRREIWELDKNQELGPQQKSHSTRSKVLGRRKQAFLSLPGSKGKNTYSDYPLLSNINFLPVRTIDSTQAESRERRWSESVFKGHLPFLGTGQAGEMT